MGALVKVDARAGIAAYARRQKAMDRDRPRDWRPPPDSVTPVLRQATVVDAAAIARVNAEAWHATYRTIMPDEVLAQATAERFELRWEELLLAPQIDGFTLVAETAEDGVVGFLRAGANPRAEALRPYELFAVNIAPRFQRFGLGRALFTAAAERLATAGAPSLFLWVLEPNTRARFFFKAMGTEIIGRGQEKLGQILVPKIAYGLEPLSAGDA